MYVLMEREASEVASEAGSGESEGLGAEGEQGSTETAREINKPSERNEMEVEKISRLGRSGQGDPKETEKERGEA